MGVRKYGVSLRVFNMSSWKREYETLLSKNKYMKNEGNVIVVAREIALTWPLC